MLRAIAFFEHEKKVVGIRFYNESNNTIQDIPLERTQKVWASKACRNLTYKDNKFESLDGSLSSLPVFDGRTMQILRNNTCAVLGKVTSSNTIKYLISDAFGRTSWFEADAVIRLSALSKFNNIKIVRREGEEPFISAIKGSILEIPALVLGLPPTEKTAKSSLVITPFVKPPANHAKNRVKQSVIPKVTKNSPGYPYSSFEYWREQRDNRFPEITWVYDDDLKEIPQGVYFLWTNDLMIGLWALFPSIDMLVGYIRNVLLEGYFKIWLDYKEDTDEPSPTVTVEELFEACENDFYANLERNKDIPFMKRIIEELDKTFTLPNDKKLTHLKAILANFNKKWSGLQDGGYRIRVCENTFEVGKFLFVDNRLGIEDVLSDLGREDLLKDFSKEAWLDLCRDVYTNGDNLALFTQVLKRLEYI